MKIVVAMADRDGCGYFRMAMPYAYLAKRGYDVHFIEKITSPHLDNADVVVLQRQHQDLSTTMLNREILLKFPVVLQAATEQITKRAQDRFEVTTSRFRLLTALKARGTKVVHEFDDNFHAVPPSNPNAKSWSSGKPQTKAMERYCREADLLTVSTEGLADEYRRINSNIQVCHNAVDDRQLARVKPKISARDKRTGQLRFGWAGTATHIADFSGIVRPLARVMNALPQSKMVFIGADMRGLLPRELWSRCEVIPPTFTVHPDLKEIPKLKKFPSVAFYDALVAADIDIALAPIQSNTFNRCKSWVKILDYGVAGCAVIASRFGPYRQYVDQADGTVIVTAGDEREWAHGLHALAESPTLRAHLATENRKNIAAEHVMSKRVLEWEAALESFAQPVAA